MRKFLVAIAPVFLILGLNLWAQANQARFPDPLATHWGITGQADGFASLETHLLWVNIGLGVVAAIWLLVSLIQVPAALRKLFQGIVGYLFAFLFVVMTQTLWMQLDVTDSSETRFGLELFVLMLPALLLVPLMLSKPAVSVGDEVKVSLRGLTFLSLELTEIRAARAGTVRAGDFGGWGIRYANKTTAFVPSSGPALELELQNGTKVLVRSDAADDLATEITRKKAQ